MTLVTSVMASCRRHRIECCVIQTEKCILVQHYLAFPLNLHNTSHKTRGKLVAWKSSYNCFFFFFYSNIFLWKAGWEVWEREESDIIISFSLWTLYKWFPGNTSPWCSRWILWELIAIIFYKTVPNAFRTHFLLFIFLMSTTRACHK